MFEMEISILLLLFSVALIGGFIDSIAGGGGSITLPTLLFAGASPLEALATNKLQSSFGSFSATRHFYKKGYFSLKQCLPYAILVFVFSAFGTLSVQFINTDFLSKFLPFLIMVFGFYFLFSPKITEEQRAARFHKGFFLVSLAGIGFYDGFFGPGTGSFLILALVALAGFGLTQSLAQAKLYNFSTNLASLIFFALGGNMLWGIGFIMAIGQIIGANLGSRAAIKYGIKLIKPLIVVISFTMALKLFYDQLG